MMNLEGRAPLGRGGHHLRPPLCLQQSLASPPGGAGLLLWAAGSWPALSSLACMPRLDHKPLPYSSFLEPSSTHPEDQQEQLK